MEEVKKNNIDWLFRLFILLSIIWTIKVFWLLYQDQYNPFIYGSMPLNEVGDFLAGSFSPLAFFWLAYGYWMQNKELKSSVEQATDAYKLTSKQFTFQKDEARKKEDLRFKEAQPIFTSDDTSRLLKDDKTSGFFCFSLKNSGGKCYKIELRKKVNIQEKEILLPFNHMIGGIESNEELRIEVSLNEAFLHELESGKFQFYITYQDSLFNKCQMIVIAKRYNHLPKETYRVDFYEVNDKEAVYYDYTRRII